MSVELLEKLDPKFLSIVHLVAECAQEENISIFLVGGIVRDLYLGKTNLDLDFVVEGSGIDFAKVFSQKCGGTSKPYYKFQTATVQYEDQRIDFAMAREETYPKPGEYPTVSASTLEKDLMRRDFTINAMALSLNKDNFGTLLDPYGGQVDLKEKKIRILHEQSFEDDPTRILRAIRFEQRLGFEIESQTLQLLKEALQKEALNTVLPKRREQEKKKMAQGQNFEDCLKRLQQLGGSAIMSGF